MGKGVIPLNFRIIISIFFVLFVVSVFTMKAAEITNPCWEPVLKGMQSLKEGREATLVLDGACLERAAFTSNPDMCEFFCSRHYDSGERINCMKSCTPAPEGSQKTFIMLMPKDPSAIDEASQTASGNLKWLLEAKPAIYTLDCRLTELRIEESMCNYIDAGSAAGD